MATAAQGAPVNSIIGDSAFLHVVRKLWQKDSEKIELDICDLIVIEPDKSISTWLFSSKEGQVKSKRKENRADTNKVWDHVSRVREYLDTASTAENTYNHRIQALCNVVENNNNTNKKWEGIDSPSALNRNCRVLVTVPTTQMLGSRLLKVDFRRDSDNLFQPAKVKCFIPKIDKRHQKTKNVAFPSHFQECHNALYSTVAASYVNKLAKILDSRSSSMVMSMVVYLCIGEVEVDAHVPVNSPTRYRAWLYFVEELTTGQQSKRQTADCSVSVSSKLTKRLDPELQSQASFIKPWAFCMGDFCFFDENGGAYRRGRGGTQDLGMDDDFDAITEGKLAIRRHRQTDGINDNVDVDDSEMEDEFSGARSVRQGDSMKGSMIPTKSRTIMVKSILLAREEMDVIKSLDHQFTGAMISKGNSSNPMSQLGFKSQIEQIWPLSIAKWWINVGQQEQPAVPKVGKVPDALLKHIRADSMEASALDAKERNKWFSWYYSQVKVCESCYFIYQELENFRQSKTKELQRNARLESNEYKMTAEQRREKDREIERRIFQQRKLMTRLSKCKSAPALGESDDNHVHQSHLMRGADSNSRLPPLAPWKATTRFNAETLNKSSVAKHIMNKHAEYVRSNESDDIDVMRRWEEVTNLPEKPKLPPVRTVLKKPPKKILNVDNYTASRLLHPWQRELGKLREEVANGKSFQDVLNGAQDAQQYQYPPQLNNGSSATADSGTNYFPDDGEDEEDNFGELGWSPFVI